MKLKDALNELRNCRITSLGKHAHGYVVYEDTASVLLHSVARRLTLQRNIAIGLLVVFVVFFGWVITIQDNIITELEARQPKITEECVNGILHRAQNFDGLKVYDSKFEECMG